jgi:N-acylneuraminate cytidylyltransferase
MFKILIPARKNSKGFPFKNRRLFTKTADIIPDKYKNNTHIFSDDETINQMGKDYGFVITDRNKKSALDQSTTKELMQDFCSNFTDECNIIMLYLTYPERTWKDVENAYKVFIDTNARSLLCRQDVNPSPYLMMYELENGMGKQIINHNLCRRQDYKKCFAISHFISIINSKELTLLNNNLYNNQTYFYPIRDVKDIDYRNDYEH